MSVVCPCHRHSQFTRGKTDTCFRVSLNNPLSFINRYPVNASSTQPIRWKTSSSYRRFPSRISNMNLRALRSRESMVCGGGPSPSATENVPVTHTFFSEESFFLIPFRTSLIMAFNFCGSSPGKTSVFEPSSPKAIAADAVSTREHTKTMGLRERKTRPSRPLITTGGLTPIGFPPISPHCRKVNRVSSTPASLSGR